MESGVNEMSGKGEWNDGAVVNEILEGGKIMEFGGVMKFVVIELSSVHVLTIL